MSSSKKQSLLVIGIAMIIIAGILLYFSLSQPKIYVDKNAGTANINADASAVYETESQVSAFAKADNVDNDSVSYPVNINTCTAAELMSIDSIGEAKASAIIEYREYLGGYTSVEQIKNIEGIGDGVYEKVAPYLCV